MALESKYGVKCLCTRTTLWTAIHELQILECFLAIRSMLYCTCMFASRMAKGKTFSYWFLASVFCFPTWNWQVYE